MGETMYKRSTATKEKLLTSELAEICSALPPDESLHFLLRVHIDFTLEGSGLLTGEYFKLILGKKRIRFFVPPAHTSFRGGIYEEQMLGLKKSVALLIFQQNHGFYAFWRNIKITAYLPQRIHYFLNYLNRNIRILTNFFLIYTDARVTNSSSSSS